MNGADQGPSAAQKQRILERLWIRNAVRRGAGKPVLDVRHHYQARLTANTKLNDIVASFVVWCNPSRTPLL